MRIALILILTATLWLPVAVHAQDAALTPLPEKKALFAAIVEDIAPARLHATVATLVGFGTRHTLSDTQSNVRGIGASRRWVNDQFAAISRDCEGCLQIATPAKTVTGERIPQPTEVMDIVAVQRGTDDAARVVIMTAHLDSRVTDILNATSDAPGANDDASGVAAVLESARVLSHYQFRSTIVYGVLSGEEQGLYGGTILADFAKAQKWAVTADLNNDIIGNTQGLDGVVDNSTVRIFSEGTKSGETSKQADYRRYTGGEVDSPSRNVARFMQRVAEEYLANFHVMMVYRTDRFGRGGDQVPFLAAGYPAVRLTEAHENYNRQHQDVRNDGGVAYGDVLDGVDFPYLAQVTRLNALSLAALAQAPAVPQHVTIVGGVSADTTLHWNAVPGAAGYRIWRRDTTSAQWQFSTYLAGADSNQIVLKNVVIDNSFFGVAAVSPDGYESPVVFPGDAGSFAPS